MDIRSAARAEWAELETRRRLSLAVADRVERRADGMIDGYEAGRSQIRRVRQQKSNIIKAGMLLIFPTVLSVPAAMASNPLMLVVGAACGAGVYLSLRLHDRLCTREDQLDHQNSELYYQRSCLKLDASNYRREAARLGPMLEESWSRLQEVEQVARLNEPPRGSALSESPDGLIVGGVRLRRASSQREVEA